ncbi:pentapeptide repeat-containing protein [Allocatelliglobosispora scoriae]|uniref:pentapeptide repeat-containing protein n=1 Tax=Allocatelliglobosispora scoriae TaxID=643052 RepID=UPI0035E428E3
MRGFREVSMHGADLSGADSSRASLKGLLLSGEGLRDVDLDGVADADVREVDLREADPSRTNLTMVRSDGGVKGDGRTTWPEAYPVPVQTRTHS